MNFDKDKFEKLLNNIKPERVLGISGLAILSAYSLFAFVVDPSQPFAMALAVYLSNIGLNVFAGLLQSNFEQLLNTEETNSESIEDLAYSLSQEIRRDARLRREIGKFLNTLNAYEIAKEVAKANPHVNSWLIYQVYNETRKYRSDFDSIHENLAEVVSYVREQQRLRSTASTRILFIDDDLLLIYPIVERLRHNGYSVTACANVKQAVEALQMSSEFSLIITDLLMPFGEELKGEATYGGFAVVEFARLLFPEIPIICLSIQYLRQNDVRRAIV